MVADNYTTEIKLAIEKSIENSKRIDRLESRIDRGFFEVKESINKLADNLNDSTLDRWTRRDHDNYSERVRQRINKIEQRLFEIESKGRREK